MNIEKTPVNCYFHGARYYDPQLSRWHCPDPLSESSTHLSPYTYVTNNPVNYVDPNGMLYAKPSDWEREQAREGGYYNWELAMKVAGMMGSQFNTTGLYHPTGGWYYSGSERGYVNMFTGERMSYNNFNQKIMPSFTSPDHTLYGDDAVMAGYDLLGYKREYFGSDHLGSQEWGVLSPVGKYTIYKKPFWEVTGSYYNHEYFLSGVEAYGDAGFVLRLITNRLDDSALIPAGYSWELNSSAEFYGAVSSSPIGILLVLRGQDAVSIRNFRSAGLGGGLAGASIQLLKTRYHYFGDINNFSLENTFYGRSFDFEFSAGHLGIIAGSSISIMFNATHHGEFLIGVGVYAGLGTPGISFSGTYQGTDKW